MCLLLLALPHCLCTACIASLRAAMGRGGAKGKVDDNKAKDAKGKSEGKGKGTKDEKSLKVLKTDKSGDSKV